MKLPLCGEALWSACGRLRPLNDRLVTAFAAAVLLAPFLLPGQCQGDVLVAQWSFEEGPADAPASGAILDSSGNGHDGFPFNGPIYLETVGGPSALALDFEGVDQYVFIPDDPAFAFTDEFTVAMWVNVRSFPMAEGTSAPIVVRGDTQQRMNAWSLAFEGSSVAFSVEDAGGNHAEISRLCCTVGSWEQIVATYRIRGSESFLHLSATDSVVTGVRLNAELDLAMKPGVYLGGIGGEFFDGLIDEVRIYNRALFENNVGGLSLLGDTNDDGAVNIDDLNNLRNCFGHNCLVDANFDWIHDIEDLNAIRNEFGQRLENARAVPEPTTWILGLLAGLSYMIASFARSSRSVLCSRCLASAPFHPCIHVAAAISQFRYARIVGWKLYNRC